MANTAAYAVSRGVQVARLLRDQRKLTNTKCCNLDALVAEDGISIDEHDTPTDDFVAALVRRGNVAGILLAPSNNPGRRRFSVAHELGHFYIPTHTSKGRYVCSANEVRATGKSGDNTEQEANEFAAELLMPRRLFSEDADKFSPSVASAIRLASPAMYDVSISAAAFRMAETTRAAMMLVSSVAGKVAWAFASKSWTYGLATRGNPVPKDSLAHEIPSRQQSEEKPLDIPSHVWIERPLRRPVTLLESCHWIPTADTVLSVLWIPAEDSEDDD